MSTFSHFFAIDELIQVIYQGFYKFVLYTKTEDDAWIIYLAMLDDDKAVFWKGAWSEGDVSELIVGLSHNSFQYGAIELGKEPGHLKFS
jgi:hypothetical protein